MIVVVGDSILDTYTYGTSTRMSPECNSAPVIAVTKTETFPGGAANVALQIDALAADVKLITATERKGSLSKALTKVIVRHNSIFETLSVRNNNPDTVKNRIYMNGVYTSRIDYDNPVDCYFPVILSMIKEQQPEFLVISDYGRGTISEPKQLMELAKLHNIKVLVDSKKDITKYPGCYVLKQNLKELNDWRDADWDITENNFSTTLSNDSLQRYRESLKADNLIITLGKSGCILVEEYGVRVIPALPMQAIDSTGAGDSFMAGLVVALSEGKSLRNACKFATKVSSISVTKRGTQVVTRKEL